MTTSDFQAQPAAAYTRETRPMYWSIRRELWENRSVTMGPVLVAAFVLFGSFMATTVMIFKLKNVPAVELAKQAVRVVKPLHVAPAPIMFSTLLIGAYFALDALYGERRDRSILFWKSLPISDRTSVLAKVAIPMAVLPAIAYVLSVIVQIILIIAGTLAFAVRGMSPAAMWGEVHFFSGLIIMAYGLGIHALWFAPVYGWFLLVGAWARRAPLLWAILPLLAIAGFERTTFGTNLFMNMLGYRFTGGMKEGFRLPKESHGNVSRLSELTPGDFFSAPGLWVGLVFAALCVVLAIRLRRNREAI